MSTALFAVSADEHLKRHIYTRFHEAHGDTCHGFQQAVDVCLERRIPLRLLGGLFDRPLLHYGAFSVARKELERLYTAGLGAAGAWSQPVAES